MMKESRKSFKSLSQTIHSLMGLKTQTTSTWANTVCEIIKSLPSTADYEKDSDDDDDFAISNIQGELAALTEEVYHLDSQRRQVLNEYLKLRGNIRVFCRIRPVKLGHQVPVEAVDSCCILLNFAENKKKMYNFDKVFPPSSSQDEVFSEIEPVIKSALDGYNVCILAYGQTGTGKTFTMEGRLDCPGVVPCTIEALFKQAAESNHTYIFSFSMLEIYLGHLRDLLIPRVKKPTDPMPPCLTIQTDPNGGIVIENLVAIQVNNFNHAISLYRLGSQFRSTASTNSNEVSSRSHCMIRMSMTCCDATKRRKITNKIWMVDLGGSERVLKTKACGRRFEEGKAINLSLSALGDVINALQTKSRHIPYRNNKLTQVLKDSLGEDSKTLMLVHVSPKEEDLCETVCSLNFAVRLRRIHLEKTESKEARVIREAAMTDLQRKMKQIENSRDKFRKEINKLNTKLGSLTKIPPDSHEKLDGSLLSMKVPQPNVETAEKLEIIKILPSPKMPRFMKPTICSTRRSGMGHQISYKKDTRPARRKKGPLSRAESVSFPIKSMTESLSGSTISNASCLVGLNGLCSADNETEYSQHTSECNFRMAIDKQDILSKSLTNQSIHSSLGENMEFGSVKSSEVDHWLHLHENTTNGSSYTRNTWHLSEAQRNASSYVNIACKESKFNNNISPIPLTDGTITKPITGVDDTSTEDDICFRIMLPDAINDRSHHENDAYEVDGTPISQVSTHETRFLEVSWLKENLTANVHSSNVESSDIGLVESFEVSNSRSKRVPTAIYENGEEQCVSSQHSADGHKFFLHEVNTLEVSSVDNLIQRDFTSYYSQSDQNAKNRGLSDILKEKFLKVYISVLLGLGFQSLGFEHEFFQALMF